jgi:hypothetical protein
MSNMRAGIESWLKEGGHELVVTDDKEGVSSCLSG